jgi:hypothetical protein
LLPLPLVGERQRYISGVAFSVGHCPATAHRCAEAKTLGLTFPIALLGRADELIE